METLLASSIHVWQPLGYVLVFVGMLFEGDAILFATIFLIHQGFFAAVPASILAVAGALIGDAMWFAIGRKIKSSEKWLKKTFDKMAGRFDKYVRHKPTEMLFVSKFIYGLHRAILLRYGESDITFRKYMSRDTVATFFWMTVVAAVAIGASSYAIAFRHDIKFVGRVLIVGIVLVFALEQVLGYAMQKLLKFIKLEVAEIEEKREEK